MNGTALKGTAVTPEDETQHRRPSNNPMIATTTPRSVNARAAAHVPVEPTDTEAPWKFQDTDDEEEEERGGDKLEDYQVEKPEPLTDQPGSDATSLVYESEVMLKPVATRETITTDDVNDEGPRTNASINGPALGRLSESFRIASAESTRAQIRYGDSVSLYSSSIRRYLGVRMHQRTIQVGFFRNNYGDKVNWEVLHGKRQLWIGPKALRSVRKRRGGGETHCVRSGDPIVLRNQETGGILSMRNGALVLLTDSYGTNGEAATPADRILHHDRIVPTEAEEFQLVDIGVPPCPQWTFGVKDAARQGNSASPHLSDSDAARIGRMTIDQQERLILDEVLGSLMGLEGHVVRIDSSTLEFMLSEQVSLERSLQNMVTSILRVSTSYLRVRRYLESRAPGYTAGNVTQALCESIDLMLDEYLKRIGTLEGRLRTFGISRGAIALSRLNVELQDDTAVLSLLELVSKETASLSGGSLLNRLLHLRTNVFAGDLPKQDILSRLIDGASIPYMRLLTSWLEKGVLDDPYGEFMVERVKGRVRKQTPEFFDGDTWDGLFRIREEHVLSTVTSPVNIQERVRITGKYWNAVQFCRNTEDEADEDDSSALEELTVRTMMRDPARLSSYVDHMYRKASSQLLWLLFHQYQVDKSLVVMKRYFLLDQGDFLVHFLDAAENELLKKLEDVSRGRTQHWLNMTVQLIEGLEEPAESLWTESSITQPLPAQSLRCQFTAESLDVQLGVGEADARTPSRNPSSDADGLTGMTAFTLGFPKMPFPTSLILSRRNMDDYKLLFRHLFFTKHVEQRLVGIWLDQQMMKEFQPIRTALGPTLLLRQRMLHFVQNLTYYMMLEVIEPNWLSLQEGIAKLKDDSDQRVARSHSTVEALIDMHREFLDSALESCLLTNKVLIQCLTRLMSTCLLFSRQMKRFMEQTGMVSLSSPSAQSLPSD